MQMDGSFHRWYEERGPEGCLMDLVDDATNTTLARLGEEETIWAAAGALRAWIERYGVPQALYVDWKNLYKRTANAQERLRGEEPVTQFGRMCGKLGIELITARSPQAKGRVERMHGTHQDRLVKELRLKNLRRHAEANAYLEAAYLPEHNRRFTRAAARPEDYHRRAPRAGALDRIFRLETERTVSDDWVVRYNNRFFQLEPRSENYAPARAKVVVCERRDGEITIEYRGHAVPWREMAATVRPREEAKRPPVGAVIRQRRWIPAANHPWRQRRARATAVVVGRDLRFALNARPSGSQGSAPGPTHDGEKTKAEKGDILNEVSKGTF